MLIMLLFVAILTQTIAVEPKDPPIEGNSVPSIATEFSVRYKDDPIIADRVEFVPRTQEEGTGSVEARSRNGIHNFEIGYIVGWDEKLAEHQEKKPQSSPAILLDECDASELGYRVGRQMCEEKLTRAAKESGQEPSSVDSEVLKAVADAKRLLSSAYSVRLVPSRKVAVSDATPLIARHTSIAGTTTTIMPREIYRSAFLNGWRETLYNFGCRELPLRHCYRRIKIVSQPKPSIPEATHDDGRTNCVEAIEWLLKFLPESKVREIAKCSLSSDEIVALEEQIEVNISVGFEDRAPN